MRFFDKMIYLRFKITALAVLITLLCPLITSGITDCAAFNGSSKHFAKHQTKNIRPYFNYRNNFSKIKYCGNNAVLSACYDCFAVPGFSFSIHNSTYTSNDLHALKYAVWSRSTFV